MAKTLDQLINEAKTALGNTEENSSERVSAQAKLDALSSVKEAGFTFTQDDLNRIDSRAKQGYESSIKDVLGMTLEEAKEVMAGVEESLVETSEGQSPGPEGKEGNVLSRVRAALEDRDKKIGDLSTSQQDFQRRYYTERVTNRLGEALKSAGLNDKYLTPAQRLARDTYDELIEKSMKGEAVADEEFQKIAGSVKEQAPVFFENEPNPDHPGIPPAPEGQEPQQITDQQRAERSEPVF